jgi:hypothetical protein
VPQLVQSDTDVLNQGRHVLRAVLESSVVFIDRVAPKDVTLLHERVWVSDSRDSRYERVANAANVAVLGTQQSGADLWF